MGPAQSMTQLRRLGLVLIAVAAGTAASQHARAADTPLGVWINDTGRGAIEIKNCTNGLCGHVVWVKAGADGAGCGKQIIGEVTDAGDGTWGGGWIYNPDKKKRYDVELEPKSNGTLRVTGFAGVRFLSRTMIWKPAPADLERCDGGSSASTSNPAKVAAAPVSGEGSRLVTTGATAPAPEATPEAKSAPAPEASDPAPAEQAADDEDSFQVEGVNLEDGIEVGNVFSMKKGPNGKCKINAPFVNIEVDCDRKGKKDRNDEQDDD